MTVAAERSLQTSATAPAVTEAIETYSRIAAVRNVLAPDLSDQELQLFALVAQRSGLDPFAKQIYAIKRKGRVTFQTGIDGLRSTAERTSEYEGSSEPVYEPADWDTRTNGKRHPDRATVIVYRFRNGRRIEQSATARWESYFPGPEQGFQWTKMPDVMLAKCAEAAALRKAFPYVLADLYVSEEMDQAGPPENAALVAAEAQPTARERIAARRQAIEETKAEPATEPTPEATEAEFTERSAGISQTDFMLALDHHRIDPQYAESVRLVMWPDRQYRLTDADRASLLAELTKPVAE